MDDSRMKLCRSLAHFVVITALTATIGGQVAIQSTASSSANAPESLKPGILIEEIPKYTEAEKAGLLPGDILLYWTRGEVHGEIQSPFDLTSVEFEQGPRGEGTLEGVRGTKRKTWTLGPDIWGIQARPAFSESLLVIYSEGREFANAGKRAEAAERWRTLTNQVSSSSPPWLSACLLYHSAELLADARQGR